MPIQLNYTDPNNGINAGVSYWFIQKFHFDQIAGTVTFDLNGYGSVALKNAGKTPFFVKTISGTFAAVGINGSTTAAAIISNGYTFALTYSETAFGVTTVFFAGGTIV
jgi:hypothetical protein